MLINDEATRQAAETIGNALGVGFTLRNAAIAGGAAHIEYPDGRALGFRPIFGGAVVQLWIVGNAKAAGEGEPPTLALLEGQLYHASLSLIRPLSDPAETDVSPTDAEAEAPGDDPAELILEKFKTDLIPAFDFKPHYVGHRPWEEAFNHALADAIGEPHTEPAAAPTQTPPSRNAQAEPGPVQDLEPAPTEQPHADGAPQVDPKPSETAKPKPRTESAKTTRKKPAASRKPRRRPATADEPA
ncbi:hypothetical protein [Streptomyces sp. NPDC090112]|uniref:hypothetical protein n=1 Tax=Streptomyces sp. NPDC090112 TaxID=3365949 RepID=UPI0038127F3C